MKYRIFLLLFCAALALGSCTSNKKYEGLPKELAELCKNIDRHPKKSELYYQRADYYYYHKDIEKGIADMQTAIKLQPDSSKYYVKLSDLYFAQRETDLAIVATPTPHKINAKGPVKDTPTNHAVIAAIIPEPQPRINPIPPIIIPVPVKGPNTINAFFKRVIFSSIPGVTSVSPIKPSTY